MKLSLQRFRRKKKKKKDPEWGNQLLWNDVCLGCDDQGEGVEMRLEDGGKEETRPYQLWEEICNVFQVIKKKKTLKVLSN